MKLEYLLFNSIVIGGPLILSFFRFIFVRIPPFKKVILPIVISALLFLIWDWAVIGYFWTFNEKYITGVHVLNIPIEEVLFFFTVPYACLFLWENIKVKKWGVLNFPIHIVLAGIGLILLLMLTHLIYSFVVICVYIVTIFLDWILKTYLYKQKNFLFFMGMVLILTLLSNGYLTARPVVLYNESVKTNIMVTTIPVEDFIYGLALITLVTVLYERKYLMIFKL